MVANSTNINGSDITRFIDDLNKRIDANNQNRERNIGSLQSLTNQFEQLAKEFQTKYGIVVDLDNIEEIYKNEVTALDSEAKEKEALVTSIENGTYVPPAKTVSVETKSEQKTETVPVESTNNVQGKQELEIDEEGEQPVIDINNVTLLSPDEIGVGEDEDVDLLADNTDETQYADVIGSPDNAAQQENVAKNAPVDDDIDFVVPSINQKIAQPESNGFSQIKKAAEEFNFSNVRVGGIEI